MLEPVVKDVEIGCPKMLELLCGLLEPAARDVGTGFKVCWNQQGKVLHWGEGVALSTGEVLQLATRDATTDMPRCWLPSDLTVLQPTPKCVTTKSATTAKQIRAEPRCYNR